MATRNTDQTISATAGRHNETGIDGRNTAAPARVL